jgi:hypothetical protein
MATLEPIDSESQFWMEITFLRHHMESLFTGMSHHRVKPLDCLIKDECEQCNLPLQGWIIAWFDITKDVTNIIF